MNGALTIGTLDGANVEMAEEMGNDNIFIFGMTVDEVEDLKRRGYNAYDYYNKLPEVKQCIDQIQGGFFSPHNPGEFQDIADMLLKWDRFLTLADYETYIRMQDHVGKVYQVRYTIIWEGATFFWDKIQILFICRRTSPNGWKWPFTTLLRLVNSRPTERLPSTPVRFGAASPTGRSCLTHMTRAASKSPSNDFCLPRAINLCHLYIQLISQQMDFLFLFEEKKKKF